MERIRRQRRDSVPCRGILFFNKCNENFANRIKERFRPLSGNLIFQLKKAAELKGMKIDSVPCRGILFFNRKGWASDVGNIKIPSPVGESYFSIKDMNLQERTSWQDSVPCRGILFFNGTGVIIAIGVYIPSPVGESYFSIVHDILEIIKDLIFRPLSGNLIFQLFQNQQWD